MLLECLHCPKSKRKNSSTKPEKVDLREKFSNKPLYFHASIMPLTKNGGGFLPTLSSVEDIIWLQRYADITPCSSYSQE